MLDKFAEELKSARENNNVSLQQIAQKSRIDLKYIESIDRGDFSFLPEIYVKAFIKQYAKIVGLDEVATIKKYEAAKEGKQYEEEYIKGGEKATDEKKQSNVGTQKKPKSKRDQSAKLFQENSVSGGVTEPANAFKRVKNNKALLGIMIAGSVIVLFLIVYFLFIKTGSDIIIAEKPYEEVQQENLQRYTAEKEGEKKAKPVVIDSLELSISASDTSWLKISIDGNKVVEFSLFPNHTKTIKAASNYSMIVGNSGGTHFKLGDKDLNFAGEKNKVKYLSIDKDGLKYLASEPTFNQN